MENKEKKAFSLIARVGSLKHAFRGIGIFVANTHNAWVEIFATIVLVIAGFYFSISEGEWLALIVSLGMLLMAEGFNTAIEVDINLTSPNYHPFARDTKDISAGAVFLSAIVVIIVAAIIFIPKFF